MSDSSTLTIRLNDKDNVEIAVGDIASGAAINASVCTQQVISAGHKVATRFIEAGESVLKYGQHIGVAKEDIPVGSHVHTHNVAYSASQSESKSDDKQQTYDLGTLTFQGYLRSNGEVGTRNYIGIMATVNCAATVVSKVAREFERTQDINHPSIDGVVPIVHQSGCGIPASTKSELSSLQRLLSGYLNHPNFFGWVIVGLGCEVNQTASLLQASGLDVGDRVKSVVIQDAGGTQKSIEKALLATKQLLVEAQKCMRTTQPASKLKLGLQCGGSDAWSGVTANPGLGVASDMLVSAGGTSILAETPEIYGAESLLYQRAQNDDVRQRLQNKVDWWTEYMAKANTDLNNNPSPGNLKGGITTILEKSLGAVAKGGQAEMVDVLEYAERATKTGFQFMDSPGYDPCSVTGEIASGATVICFTTGRGSTFGAAGAPCIKLASNSPTYHRMQDDMDINCGTVVTQNVSLPALGEEIFARILEVASGAPTKSEALGLGHYEFVPWQKGVVV